MFYWKGQEYTIAGLFEEEARVAAIIEALEQRLEWRSIMGYQHRQIIEATIHRLNEEIGWLQNTIADALLRL